MRRCLFAQSGHLVPNKERKPPPSSSAAMTLTRERHPSLVLVASSTLSLARSLAHKWDDAPVAKQVTTHGRYLGKTWVDWRGTLYSLLALGERYLATALSKYHALRPVQLSSQPFPRGRSLSA